MGLELLTVQPLACCYISCATMALMIYDSICYLV
jgi:hypothetical protein